MKFVFNIIVGFFFSFNLISKEITIDIFFVSDAIENKVMKFGDILTYRHIDILTYRNIDI